MIMPEPQGLAFDGRKVGLELRELIRALFGFADPRQAVSGELEIDPEPQPPKETPDG
jgi:hypothetical protein